jgi:4-amino-4-deoxy-L-arabinose transferase-like glycosyltransferase
LKPVDAPRDIQAGGARSAPIAAVLAAFVLALGSQMLTGPLPWVSLAGFFVAVVLFAHATRDRGAFAPPHVPPLRPPGQPFWLLFFGGVLLSALAAVAVLRHAPARLGHGLWDAALVCFAVAIARGGASESRSKDLFWRRALLLAALALFAALIFGWRLAAIPPEVHGDDAEVGLDAIGLLERFNLFETGWFQLPRLHALPAAIGIWLFGVDLFGLRIPCAAMGVASVLLLYSIGRRLWGPRVAVIAALLLASQRFFIHLSRAGFHYIETPFVSLLAVWLLLRLVQDRRWGAAVACGAVLGLGFQTYYATRLVPALLVATCALGWWSSGRRQTRLGLVALAVILVAGLATAAPMLAYFYDHPDELWQRTLDTSVFSEAARAHLAFGYGTDSLARILLLQAREGLGLFNVTPDTSLQYGMLAPLLDRTSAALFPLGIATALAGARRPRNQLLLLWIFVPVVVGTVLTVDSPFYPRMSGAVPFIVLAVAVALDRVLEAVDGALRPRFGRGPALAAAAIALAAIIGANLVSYFVGYAPHHRNSSAVDISRWVREHGAGKTTYMVGGAPHFFMHHGAIRFLTWGYETRDIVDLDEHLRTHAADPRSSLFVIMPAGEDLIPKLVGAYAPLRVEEHHAPRGDVAFFSAIPQAAEDEPGLPPLNRSRAGRAIFVLAYLTTALAIVTAAFLRTRRVAAAVPRTVARPSGGGWVERFAGPDDREGRFEPPRWLVLLLLAAVLALATGLRVHRLAELPPGFYCDEAGLGYNAASILRTGYDETGTFLPLYVWSFGTSYKNPVFIYSSMLPIALLGPTEMALRLTAAFYGVATVLAVFFLGRAVMGTWAGLAAAALLAACPWHIHFSRIAFELIAFPFFVTAGVTCLVHFDRGRRTLPAAMLFLGIALYTYVPAKLFVPLLLAGYAFVSYRTLLARRDEVLAAAVVLLVVALPVVVFDVAHRDLTGAYFRRTSLLYMNEPPLTLVATFFSNYAAFLSPDFLLFSGGDRVLRHAVRNHGELYPFFAPLLLLGLLVTLTRRDRALALPLLWVALYPIAPALMNEIPSASRGFIGSVGLCLLAGLGLGALLRLPTQFLERRSAVLAAQIGLFVAAGLVSFPAVRQYWRLYAEDYPRYAAKFYTGFQYGNAEVAQYFMQHADDYESMVLTLRMNNQPDVFLRFYDGLARPPRTDVMPPFEHAGSMRAGWPDALDQYRGQTILFGLLPEEVALFDSPRVLDRILAPDGSVAFVLAEAERLKDFVHTWRVAGPFTPDEAGPPPEVDPESMRGSGPGGRRWRSYHKRLASVGLNDVFSMDADDTCAWAVNFVHSDEARRVTVWAGFDDSGKVWLNGEPLALSPRGETEDALADATSGAAELRGGRNTVAVWTCDERGDWRFYFRLSSPDGQPIPDLWWEFHDRADGR